MSNPGRFTGIGINPERAAQTVAEQQGLVSIINNFADQLEPDITQAAPRTVTYRQMDGRTCFYASLIGIRNALNPEAQPISDRSVAAQALEHDLLTQHGARTWSEFQEQQKRFVACVLGLEINFLHQGSVDRVDALTYRMKNKGNPVVFGPTHNHWIALDGFIKGNQGLGWIGMDPASGEHLEESGRIISAQTVLTRVIEASLPVVVVEGVTRAVPRFAPAAKQPARFSPVHKRFRGTNS